MTSLPAALGIGTAAFLANYGLRAGVPPGEALLRAAVGAGVRYFDTAADYADGELAVGRVREPAIRVCTKIKHGDSIDAVRTSIERLGAPADTILIHSAGRAQLEAAPAIAALEEARERGFTSRIGASTYGAEDAAFALSQPWVTTVQIEYSILNQSVLARAGRTAHAGQEVVVRSVLCKGLLTSRRTAAPHLVASVRDAIDGIERCAMEWDRSIEALAIRFALDTPGVDVMVVGVSNRQELDAALAAAESPQLTAEQWTRLASFDRSDADAAHPERWSGVS